MKYLIILCVILISGSMAHGQLPGFPLHANGLLYSDTLMDQLRHLADSMRARAGVARAGAVRAGGAYYSPKQTTARVLCMDTGDIYGAFNDLKKGISFEAFVRKYPQTEVDNKILVILDERPGYQVAGNATYYNVSAQRNKAARIILPTDEHYRPIAGGPLNYRVEENSGINDNCVYSVSTAPHTNGGKFSNEAYVFAFYLDSVPAATRLPGSAERLIGWRDKMVDTAIGVYYKNARWTSLDFRDLDFGPAQKAFDGYIDRKGDSMVAAYRPDHPYKYPKNARMEDFQLKQRYIDSLAVDTAFKRLLAAAIAEVEQNNYYPFIYLERYMDAYSPPAALDIRRRWQPVMMDNFDQLTPRLAEIHIAYLAAGLGNWSVFLRAHLSLALDPWGHYPDPARPGYRVCFLRELEELNIGVDEILLGNELTSPWPDPTFSRARVLGRALALEGGDRDTLEEAVLKLIADSRLDAYHRLAMHYLFLNYISFLPPEPWRSKALAQLERADETLPNYLSASVKVQEQAVDNRRDLTP